MVIVGVVKYPDPAGDAVVLGCIQGTILETDPVTVPTVIS